MNKQYENNVVLYTTRRTERNKLAILLGVPTTNKYKPSPIEKLVYALKKN